ncbi:hypothetical protein [Luteibacter yeojuensis]|nr:hypothetical protein [Luteibacter yeojuensis]
MTRWNVFWTGGCCPGCGHAWKLTACYACHKATPLAHWYHYPDDADATRAVQVPASV